MKTKVKKFSHKLLALFLAVLMAVSCLSVAFSAYGETMSNDKTYTGDSIEYNNLGWAVLSDEQVATALLDYADAMLAEYGPQVDNLLKYQLPSSITQYITWDENSRELKINAYNIISGSVKVHTHSVDELMETLVSVSSLINQFSSFVGDAKNIQFDAIRNGDGWVTRSTDSSTDIIRRVLGLLLQNSSGYGGYDLVGQILRGDFSLGTIGSLASIDIYKIIGEALGISGTDYKSDMVYNIAQHLIFTYTDWYTDTEISNFKNGTTTWNYDTELLSKLSTELLSKISVLVTYNQEYTDSETKTAIQDTSATRYAKIKAEMTSKGVNYATAAANLGYDPDIVYSDEFKDDSGNPLNVLLFAYGSPDDNGYPTSSTTKLSLGIKDTLFNFGYQALKLAWNTVLKGTIKLLHVNDSYDKGHGANFDNHYYYYYDQKGEWSTSDLASNYTSEKLKAWAEDVYTDYSVEADADKGTEAFSFASADEFLSYVKDCVSYDRSASSDSEGKWSDIDATQLFAKLRYSPLADYGFGVTTGPINLYFAQTGTPNLDEFFNKEYSNYSSMVAGLNDALVAAVKDLFPTASSHHILGTTPTMATTGDLKDSSTGYIEDAQIKTITETLVSNALKMVQYVADATDANILKAFYTTNGESATLSESNLESAMMPLLVSCIGEVNVGSGKLKTYIHKEDWDKCVDAEALAYVCLREYLSYVLPNRDYSALITTTKTAYEVTLEAILKMARDAVAYVVQASVPIPYLSGGKTVYWDTENEDVTSDQTLITLANGVLCYYAQDYNMQLQTNNGEKAMGIGALLGFCSATDGSSTISLDNGKTLWQNLDTIINKLLPVVGELQGNGSGKADSESLIMGDIVNSILNIANENSTTGYCGVSNFIYRLLTIVSSDPIQKTSIVRVIYDFLKNLINGLFGARYTNQSYKTIVPDASSDTPFDDFFKVGVLIGSSSTPGALQKLICNFVEFSGFSGSDQNTSAYPDSILRGICFAIQAVNSFLPDAITSIGDHELKMASAKFDNSTVTGTSGGTQNMNLTVTNNAVGIDASFLDLNKSKDNQVTQVSRYYVKIVDVTAKDENGTEAYGDFSEEPIDPGESQTVPITIDVTLDPTTQSSAWTATVTYVITDKDGNVLYGDETAGNSDCLTTAAYIYFSASQSWAETVYDESGSFASQSEYELGNVKFAGDSFQVTYPKQMVVESNTISNISKYTFSIKNSASSSKNVDGAYTYSTETVTTNNLTTAATEYVDDSSLSSVKLTSDNAIPYWDRETGSILNLTMYDYREETSAGSGVYGSWQRNGTTGYTQEQVTTYAQNASNAGKDLETRPHVVYTLQEALNAKIIAAYHINEAGSYDYMYLSPNGVAYSTLLKTISLAYGDLEGLYIGYSGGSYGKDSTSTFTLFSYYGSATVPAGTYNEPICLYNSGGSGLITDLTLTIGNMGSAYTLTSNYNALLKTMSNYKISDFADGKGQELSESAKSALLEVLAVQSTPSTPTSAADMADTTQLTANVADSTSEYGDRAYVPYTTSNETVTVNGTDYKIPSSVAKNAYVGQTTSHGVDVQGIAGVYYYDAAATMPIYSPQPLTSPTASSGRYYDAAGVEVLKNTDGKYYVRNTVKYEQEWDTETYSAAPYLADTTTQATDNNGNKLYNQIQFVYRDASGNKVNSTESWACKFANATEQTIPNSTDSSGNPIDNRGTLTKAIDKITYVSSLVSDNLNDCTETVVNSISEKRDGLISDNFDVTTYNKMVEYAQKAEKNFTVDVSYTKTATTKDDDGNTVTSTKSVVNNGMSWSDFNTLRKSVKNDSTVSNFKYTYKSDLSSTLAQNYIDRFNVYANAVFERGYIGDWLESEVLHASGNAYTKMTAVATTYDESTGLVSANGSVTKGTGASDPRFGAWASDGSLSNTGSTVYTAESWQNYVNALANAVHLATYGNGDYTYKDAANFKLDNKDDYTDEVTNVYTAFRELKAAELALEDGTTYTVTVEPVANATVTIDGAAYSAPLSVLSGKSVTVNVTAADGYKVVDKLIINGVEREVTLPTTLEITADTKIEAVVEKDATAGITISGTVYIAQSIDGSQYSNKGIDGIDILVNGEVVGTSGTGGAFSVTVPTGTTELTFHRDNTTIDRTVKLGGTNVTDAVVSVITCDYTGDKKVNGLDIVTFASALSGADNKYCDLNTDGKVNGLDTVIFSAFLGKTADYVDITLG